jgi:hypothetical protein
VPDAPGPSSRRAFLKALREGRTCRVIVTGVGKQNWSGSSPPLNLKASHA